MLDTLFTMVRDVGDDRARPASRQSVTVVIAAWRAAATIGRAVGSALAQPEAAEVIVVDDASADGEATLSAARAVDDGSGRLKVFALDRNADPPPLVTLRSPPAARRGSASSIQMTSCSREG
jgi:succinoglycan biosynthesis protein ExoU